MVKTFGEGTAVTRVPEGGFARWGVFDEFAELRHKMDELFSRSFGYTPLSRLLPNEPYVYEPIVDRRRRLAAAGRIPAGSGHGNRHTQPALAIGR